MKKKTLKEKQYDSRTLWKTKTLNFWPKNGKIIQTKWWKSLSPNQRDRNLPEISLTPIPKTLNIQF